MNCKPMIWLVLCVAGVMTAASGNAWSSDGWVTPPRVSISDEGLWPQRTGQTVGALCSVATDSSSPHVASDPLSPSDLPCSPVGQGGTLAEPATFEPSGTCGISCNPCCEQSGDRWLDNTLVFLAGDGWKNIFDDDDNNNFGYRAGFNSAVAVPGNWALRCQVGLSYGAYDFHGREGLLARDDPIQQQIFATAGVYKRSDILNGDDLAWGVVYDLMSSDEAGERNDDILLSQLRSTVGIALNESDEVGVWASFRLMSDYSTQQRMRVNVTDQVSLFWHHHWRYGGDTSIYVGWADDPGETVIGFRGEAPLNRRLALFGNVQFIIPSTTGGDGHPNLNVDDVFIQEAWNVSLGLVFYPWSKATSQSVSGNRGLPLLPVADNGSFSFQAPLF